MGIDCHSPISNTLFISLKSENCCVRYFASLIFTQIHFWNPFWIRCHTNITTVNCSWQTCSSLRTNWRLTRDCDVAKMNQKRNTRDAYRGIQIQTHLGYFEHFLICFLLPFPPSAIQMLLIPKIATQSWLASPLDRDHCAPCLTSWDFLESDERLIGFNSDSCGFVVSPLQFTIYYTTYQIVRSKQRSLRVFSDSLTNCLQIFFL